MKRIALGVFFFLSPFVPFLVLYIQGYDENTASIPLYFKVLSVWGALSAWILFFWMVVDLVRRKDLQKKRYWGISFFLLGPIAIAFYFPFSFIPRIRKELTGNLPAEKYKPKRPDGFTLIALYLAFTSLGILLNFTLSHSNNYPVRIIIDVLIFAVSVLGTYGLWCKKEWSDKIILLFVILMMVYMAVFQVTAGGFPLWQFAIAFIVLSVPLLLMYRYVRIKIRNNI